MSTNRCPKINAVARSLPLALACGLSQFAYPLEVLAQPLPAISPAIYPYYLDPATYADYTRRPLPVADWSTFQNEPQFVVSRRGVVDEAYFSSHWKEFRLLFTPPNAGPAVLKIQNIDCDGTVLIDDVQFRVAGGLPEAAQGSATNWLVNPGFERTDPGDGWIRTPGVNVYRDGHDSARSMLVRAGHSLEAVVSVQAQKPYELSMWFSVAGRSRGGIRVSVAAPAAGSASLNIAEETASTPSGFVLWPTLSTIIDGLRPAELDAMNRHGFVLHNPWGYVPVDHQTVLSSDVLATITNSLRNRYTGADIGEQEARFANVFEAVYEPFPRADHFRHYRTALQYTEHVGDDLGNVMSLLVNLWFWHYPVKNANVLIAGAQAQPKEGISNSQVQYSFLRGAGKQYGVPWFGNASVFSTDWDREGPQKNWKSYSSQATNGSSLNLMRRLMFTHYLYGCSILSFESGWRTDQKTVSPIGLVQEAMVQTVNQYGRPGVMHTPVALLLDFYSGWMPAQYNRGNYYVWNAVDYGPGDHLTHNVFSLLYPYYEANGFFQNELGGLSDTPFGDMADTLLTDVTAPVLSRYGVVIAAGNLPSANTELRDKLESFLAVGGNLIVTGENARRLWPEFGIGPRQITIPANGVVSWIDSTASTEINSGSLYSVAPGLLPADSQVLATYAGSPAAIDIPRGAGRITLLASPLGLNDAPLTSLHPPYAWNYNVALPQPYALMSHVRRIIEDRFSGQRLFKVGNSQLGYITCRQAPGQYLVGIHNNSLTSRTFRVSSLIGPITSFTELDLGRSVTNEPGYWPLGYATNSGGFPNGSNIFGGDIRLFRLSVAETNTVRVLGSNLPPARPFNRMVAVPALCNLKDTLLRWFTFFEHFDGVKLDWTSVRSADLGFTNGGAVQLREPINWLQRQQVRFVTDFSSGLISRELTLQTNAPGTNYQQSLAEFNRVMDKLSVLRRATDLIISAEDIPDGQMIAVRAGVAAFCSHAASRGMTVHFKHRTTPWTPNVAATLRFMASVGAGNLKFAANTADAPGDVEGLLAQAGGQLGLILIEPLANGATVDLLPVRSRNVIQILDAEYPAWDQIYLDLRSAWVASGAASLAGKPLTPMREVYWTTHPGNKARLFNLHHTADLPGTLREQTNFWNYFGGAKVDYKYLAYRDPAQCAREAAWLADRKVNLVVDFSSDLNNYPGLTLTDSSSPGDGLSANYQRSRAIINDVFDKMQLMGVADCVIRTTTTNAAAYTDLCNRAWARGKIQVHLQHHMANWMTRFQSPTSVAALIDAAAPANSNLKMAVNGNHDADMAGLLSTAGRRLGLILLGYPGSSRADVHGQARLGLNQRALLGQPQPQILDSEYADWNDTAQDLVYLGWAPVTPPVMPKVK